VLYRVKTHFDASIKQAIFFVKIYVTVGQSKLCVVSFKRMIEKYGQIFTFLQTEKISGTLWLYPCIFAFFVPNLCTFLVFIGVHSCVNMLLLEK
jgi:hypothetical protein